MKWIRNNKTKLPIVATVGNSFFIEPKVYSLVEYGITWVDVVKIKPEKKKPFWRVVYIENGEYKTKEFRYLKEAKKYAEEILRKRLGEWKWTIK